MDFTLQQIIDFIGANPKAFTEYLEECCVITTDDYEYVKDTVKDFGDWYHPFIAEAYRGKELDL